VPGIPGDQTAGAGDAIADGDLERLGRESGGTSSV
jgi:hypothetical protein